MWRVSALSLAAALLSPQLFNLCRRAVIMSSSEKALPDHNKLISVLFELYTLFDTLSAVPFTSAALTAPDTGVHAPGDFDAEGACAAGFSQEVVRVLSMIPYPGYEIEIQPQTRALSYLGRADFEKERDLIYGYIGELLVNIPV